MSLELLTVEEVAKLLQVHTVTVYRMAEAGKLPGFKVGNRWRFQRDSLERWMVDQAQLNRLEAEDRLQPKRGYPAQRRRHAA